MDMDGVDEEVTRDLGGKGPGSRKGGATKRDRSDPAAVLAAGLEHDLDAPRAVLQRELARLAGALKDIEHASPTARDPATLRLAEALARGRAALVSIDYVASYMTRLVHDYVRTARGERPVKRRTEMSGVVDAALHLAEDTTGCRAVLAVRVTRGLAAAVSERTLVRVLVNLIVNAAEAFPSGDPARNYIEITARGTEQWVIIEVKDTAGGVASEIRDRLFEPFVTTKGGERGLGLAVARTLVRAAGGDLELVATGASGTTFRCTLPAAR